VIEPARRDFADAGTAHRLELRDMLKVFMLRRRIVLPLLGAMALMSAGDFSLLNWTPALLSRVFHLSPAAIGSWLGTIVIVTGLVGTILGGVVSDILARTGGLGMRAWVAAAATSIALPGAFIWAAPSVGWVLAAFSLWSLFSSAAATIGITTVQEEVPNAVRGVSVASISFGNMFIGLGFGTMATALLTDQVFGDPLAVARSIGLVMTLTGALGTTLYVISAKRLAAATG
jgi:MFS family permease